MQQKFISVDGIKIAYLEKNPESDKTIFFIHGNSSSSRIWTTQLESDRFLRYRMIAFDLPAHGNSDSFEGSGYEYSLPTLGNLISRAIKELEGGRQYIVAGMSLGTNVLAETLAYDVSPTGLFVIGSCVLGGTCTMDKVFKQGVDLRASLTDDFPIDELKAFSASAFETTSAAAWNSFQADYYAVKDCFRSRIFATALAGNLNDEVGLLVKSKLPVAVIFGDNELVCEKEYLDNVGLNLWNNQTYKIAGAGHLTNVDKPQEVNNLLDAFAQAVFK